MNKDIITINKKDYKRVQKRTAEKMFNNGENIFLIPCNVNPYSPWIQFASHKKHTTNMQEFGTLCNEYCYYNCNAELGKYLHFYMEV